MTILECVQGSPEWLAARVGRVTGSRVCDVLAMLKKGGESAARRNYRYEIATEILTGLSVEHYITKEMEWGIENELFARAAYEVKSGNSVDDVGFATHSRIERFGASPDGLIGDDGLLEIKCPTTPTHLDYILDGVVPEQYQPQMLAEMLCTGRKWCDFVSFDPRLPYNLQLFIRRFGFDEKRAGELEKAVETFLEEVDGMIALLNEAA